MIIDFSRNFHCTTTMRVAPEYFSLLLWLKVQFLMKKIVWYFIFSFQGGSVETVVNQCGQANQQLPWLVPPAVQWRQNLNHRTFWRAWGSILQLCYLENCQVSVNILQFLGKSASLLRTAKWLSLLLTLVPGRHGLLHFQHSMSLINSTSAPPFYFFT
jgi:hypothetical protein